MAHIAREIHLLLVILGYRASELVGVKCVWVPGNRVWFSNCNNVIMVRPAMFQHIDFERNMFHNVGFGCASYNNRAVYVHNIFVCSRVLGVYSNGRAVKKPICIRAHNIDSWGIRSVRLCVSYGAHSLVNVGWVSATSNGNAAVRFAICEMNHAHGRRIRPSDTNRIVLFG